MVKIKYLKNYGRKEAGDVESVSKNVAFGLIDSGIAIKENGYRASIIRNGKDKMMRTAETEKEEQGETREDRKARRRKGRLYRTK